MTTVLQKDIEYFINDFEGNSQTELIEGKEKDELQRIAEARGMKIKGSRDLAVFKTIYAFTDKANCNGDILPEKELLKVLPQIIGKPVSVNHNRRFVVGHYIDYKYIQKAKTIIAYGVFYKSNFGPEWKRAQKLFKSKKLSSSFEIWTPESARKIRTDGSCELRHMELAGGALIFQDEGEFPSFKGADVLTMASKQNPELVYASKYKENEILKGNFYEDSVKESYEKIKLEEKQSLLNKVTCKGCQEEFETEDLTNIKCPKCFSILKNDGEIMYPPQLKDFKVTCPSCKNNEWLIVKNEESKSELKCQSCAKEYVISFAKPEKVEGLDKINFLYSSTVNCIQCGNSIVVSGFSKQKTHKVSCNKCGIKFNVDVSEESRNRVISSIEEKVEDERREVEMTENKDNVEKTVDENKDVNVQPEDVSTPAENNQAEGQPKAENNDADKEVITKSSANKGTVATETPEAEPIIHLGKDLESSLEESKKLTYQERKGLKDTSFAVVKTVKNEKTGKARKIRMFPIHDKAHVRNALARLSQATETLNKLGVSINSVKAKILKKARTLGMVDLVNNYKLTKANALEIKRLKAVNQKAISKIFEMKKAKKLKVASVTAQAIKSKDEEIEKIRKDADEKIKLYKANAQLITARRTELGEEYSKDIEDKDIINDVVFEKVKLEKANAKLRAQQANEGTDNVAGTKTIDEEALRKASSEITNKAFGI